MTQNHDYTTPDQGRSDWHVPLNENFVALDRDVPVWDTESNKSDYTPVTGAHFIATDSGVLYQGDGSAWVAIGELQTDEPELYSQPSAPSSPTQNDVWFDQTEGTMKYYDGSSWVTSGDTTSDAGSGDDTDGGSVSSDIYIPMDGQTVDGAYDTSYGTRSGNYSIVEGDAYAGSEYLTAQLDSGGHWGGNLLYYFPAHDMGQPDEVYTRIHIRLDPDWEMADSNTTCKLYWAGTNLEAGDGGLGGGVPTGDNGWSVRVFCRGSSADGAVTPSSYIYHMDQGGQYGDMVDWNDEFVLGQWHQIDTYVKLNSVDSGSANSDGVYRAWLDGSLQDEHTGMRWRTTEDIGTDRVGPGTYWGGTEVSPQTQYVDFDEHRISVGKSGL
jgi:hypothetical protein